VEYVKDEVCAELGKVIEEKGRENQAIKRENEERRRKLREAGIDVP
jgi:hypothetical protein